MEGTEKGSLGREILEENFLGHIERWGKRESQSRHRNKEGKRQRDSKGKGERDTDGAETGLQPGGGGGNQAGAGLLKGT